VPVPCWVWPVSSPPSSIGRPNDNSIVASIARDWHARSASTSGPSVGSSAPRFQDPRFQELLPLVPVAVVLAVGLVVLVVVRDKIREGAVGAGRPLNLAFHSFEARHACNRAASSSSGIGLWAYLAVFAAIAAGYRDIPIIGTAATGAVAGPAVRLNRDLPGLLPALHLGGNGRRG
jgi:hypothetical protein